MPSTVYKGDLAEVSFAPETGMRVEKNVGSSVTIVSTGTGTILTIDGTAGSDVEPIQNGVLTYPKGMLIGSKLVFFQASSSSTINNADVDGRVFTIVNHTHAGSHGADGTVLTISPAMVSGDITFANNDGFEILPFCTPPIDPTMTFNDAATTSEESCKIDQFLGIASAITLPETKVDLKRFHVIGLGRDVTVQVPGKFVTEGGSFEVNMHTARWLKYCLGQEVVHLTGLTSQTRNTLASATEPGQSHITLSNASGFDIGEYVYLNSGTAISVVSDHEPEAGTWTGTAFSGLFDKANPYEVRRIVAKTSNTLHLDEPLYYAHATTSNKVELIDYNTLTTNPPSLNATTNSFTNATCDTDHSAGSGTSFGSNPKIIRCDDTTNIRVGMTVSGTGIATGSVVTQIQSSTLFYVDQNTTATNTNETLTFEILAGHLSNAVNHLIFSKDTLPSFCLEVSQRRRDVDSNVGTADGSVTDSKELTRVYRGCKVKDWTLSTDNDAALRLAVNFDSALCYTDTGRLEATTPGSRYNAHRMFDDTASTALDRRKSGIEIGSQKPFMFYNGSIKLAGVTIGQVISFTLTGATGLQTHYAINGNNTPSTASTDQVPFSGSRNPAILVEGQTEYSMDMEIIVDDPIFFHKMRTATEFSNNATNQIVLEFIKNGSGTTREKMAILIDDYYITEAPIQLPEDKGAVKSALKVMPKAIKVISRDSILKY